MLPSNSTLLMLGDSCAPASNPPPTGGGLFVASQSLMPLLLSLWRCELIVMLVGFTPDCPSASLCESEDRVRGGDFGFNLCVALFPNIYVPNFKLEDLHWSCSEVSQRGWRVRGLDVLDRR